MASDTKRDTKQSVKKISDAKKLHDLRLKKYTFNTNEIQILKKIYEDINIKNKNTANVQQPLSPLTLDINTDFRPDPEMGYKTLAEKFKKKIDEIKAYNKEREKRWFGFLFTKDTRALEGALTFINQHTYNRISLDNVATNYTNYVDDEGVVGPHKKYIFPSQASYTFSATNLLTTLEEKAKHFFGWSYGSLAKLKDEFAHKITVIKEDISKLAMKKDKEAIQRNMDSNDVKILPIYDSPDEVPQGAINHFNLRGAILNTSKYIKEITNESFINYTQDPYYHNLETTITALKTFESNKSLNLYRVDTQRAMIFDKSLYVEKIIF